MSPKKIKHSLYIASFENASILRKFSILFLLASIIPLAVLCYFYWIHKQSGTIDVPETSLRIMIGLMALGSFIGYFSMRSIIATVVKMTETNRRALKTVLSPEDLEKLNEGDNEIVILSRSFSAVTKKLENNIQSLELAKKTLQSVMAKVGNGISNMEKIDSFLNLILETVTNALNGKVSSLLILNEQKTELTINTVYGTAFNQADTINIKLYPGSPLLRVIEEKRPAVISGAFLEDLNTPATSKIFGDNLLCAPLIYRDKVKGLLTLNKISDDSEPFSNEDINLVFHLASQTAVALENSRLNNDIEKTYFETISALALAVDAKDRYSRGHLERVSMYVQLIGKELGLDQEDLKTLRDAAQIHDLGKIGIPDEILLKDGPLNDEEWVVMRRHPEIGESIIKPVRSLTPLCDIIRHHHEKLDGSGYPDKLKDDEISPLVRILTVADIYDALTTERSYRNKRSSAEAFKILRSMTRELDQDIVEVFYTALEATKRQK